MKCELCKKEEANKKNTHYLTDAIIRTCLNQDGTNKRDKGFCFEVSSNSEYSELKIQRGTSPEKIEKSLGRPMTDEEIEHSQQNSFTVDDVFCPQCESIFTGIETDFISNILPRFRNTDLSRNEDVEIQESEVKSFRLFFYLQLWRSHICDSNFNLREDIAENLRQIILNHDSIKLAEINKYPLSITYLETLGGDKEYTRNLVGTSSGGNPYVIIMNDFIIQFYDSAADISYYDLYGINDIKSFVKYINQNEAAFQVQIVHDNDRREFTRRYMGKKSEYAIPQYIKTFKSFWKKAFNSEPSGKVIRKFNKKITKRNFNVQSYSQKKIETVINDFINEVSSSIQKIKNGKNELTKKHRKKKKSNSKNKVVVKRKKGKGIITKRRVRRKYRRKLRLLGVIPK